MVYPAMSHPIFLKVAISGLPRVAFNIRMMINTSNDKILSRNINDAITVIFIFEIPDRL